MGLYLGSNIRGAYMRNHFYVSILMGLYAVGKGAYIRNFSVGKENNNVLHYI